MSQVNLYQMYVPGMCRSMRALINVIQKGQDYADSHNIPHKEFLEARIAPDMLPFPAQIKIMCNTAKFIPPRIAGVENVSMEDNEQTFDELKEKIRKTIAILEATPEKEYIGKENVEVKFRDRQYNALEYLQVFAIPNFYFHVTAAYLILRMKGVDVMKNEYLGDLKWPRPAEEKKA